MSLRGRGYRLVDFGSDDPTLGLQGKRNRKRALARVGADLEIAADTQEACQ